MMGGTIFHMIVGIKIMWGNITPYITSYLVQYDPSVTSHHTLHVYTAIFLGQSLFMYMGGQLEKKVGPRPTSFIGAVMISGCTYASSFSTSLYSLIFLQAMVGVGIGLSYSAPIICCFSHFKQNKGIVTGIITTGTGAGPFLAGLVATTYVNSENYPVDSETGLYDPNTSPVVSRVPDMFRVLGIMYGCIGLVGASLLMSPSTGDEKKEAALMLFESGEHAPLASGTMNVNIYDEAMMGEYHNPSGTNTAGIQTSKSISKGRSHQRYGSKVKFTTTMEMTTGEMIHDPLCWLLIATAICTGVPGFYVAATYKNFGETAIADDHFITVIGCFGCLCSGVSRMLWGLAADKIGTFETLELTAYSSPIVMIVYVLTAESKLAFGITVCLLFGLWGASYCLIPAIAAFLFGDKHLGTNYGFIFFVFGVMCTVIIDSAGFTGYDFAKLNYVFIVIGCIGAALCSRIRYLTSAIKDEKVLRHHRATSSVSSMM